MAYAFFIHIFFTLKNGHHNKGSQLGALEFTSLFIKSKIEILNQFYNFSHEWKNLKYHRNFHQIH
jgi:hypothetical protein